MIQKYSKYIIIILSILLVVGGLYAIYFYRFKTFDTCEKVLSNKGENTLCIQTNYGNLVFQMRPESGPNAVSRMKDLANNKNFYDGLQFYRLVKDFVLQGGVQDVYQNNNLVQEFTGKTDERIKLYNESKFEVEVNLDSLSLTDETKKSLTEEGYISKKEIVSQSFKFGDISFANAGFSSNSTEIFIVTSKDQNSENIKFLNGRFTNFGSLIEGAEILEKLNSATVDASNSTSPRPIDRIEMIKVRAK